MIPINRIFVDMDGVLADFVRGVESPKYLNGPFDKQSDYDQRKVELSNAGLFRDLPPMADMQALVNYCKNCGVDWEILSCSGMLNRTKVTKDKIDWIRQYVHPSVIITCTLKGKEKAVFARPGHVLIDDKPSNITAWQNAGGIGIFHTNAADTIKQLQDLIN
jgi:5'(3')-deoxyribonucleotidase